jgi:hypothetical protein
MKKRLAGHTTLGGLLQRLSSVKRPSHKNMSYSDCDLLYAIQQLNGP